MPLDKDRLSRVEVTVGEVREKIAAQAVILDNLGEKLESLAQSLGKQISDGLEPLAAITTSIQSHDDRIRSLEGAENRLTKVLKWTAGVLGAICAGIVLAWLKTKLGV